MARQDWKVYGYLYFKPQLKSFKKPTYSLAGVRVRVSAKESGLDPDWQVWGEAVTDTNGKFEIKKQKDKSKRRFRVEIRFENDEYAVYEKEKGIDQALENLIAACTPGRFSLPVVQAVESHLTKLNLEANWITIHKDDRKNDKKGPGDVEIKNLVFKKSGREDLGDDIYRKHAEIWWILRRMEQELGGLTGKRKVGVKYPHHNKLFALGIAANLGLGGLSKFNRDSETSYANPINNVAYIIGNKNKKHGKDDFFDISTLMHEVAHLWAYEHSTGEDALAPYLLMHGSTHDGKQKKSYISFHEAFAEWLFQRLHKEIFTEEYKETQPLPYSRDRLKSEIDGGLRALDDVEFYEDGWMSLFNMMITRDLTSYSFNEKFNTDNDGYVSKHPVAKPAASNAPGFTFKEVLSIFDPQGDTNHKMSRGDMTIKSFLARAVTALHGLSKKDTNNYMKLLDPNVSDQPWSLW